VKITTRVMYDMQRLDSYERSVPKRAESMVRLAADLIVTRARELVPVETGALRDSIHVESVEVAGDLASALISTGPGQPSLVDDSPRSYGLYVEWGHGPNPFRPDGSPRPFLVPAAVEVMDTRHMDSELLRVWSYDGWRGA
jgi:hypothetical protein